MSIFLNEVLFFLHNVYFFYRMSICKLSFPVSESRSYLVSMLVVELGAVCLGRLFLSLSWGLSVLGRLFVS